MRLVNKVALLLLAAATVPLATAGFALIARNGRALEAAVKQTLDQTARHGAAVVAADVEGRARQLTQTATLIAWDKLSAAELAGALEILKRQTRARAAELVPAGSRPGIVAPYERARKEGAGAVVYAAPRHDGRGASLAAATAVAGGVLALEIPLDDLGRKLDEVRDAEPFAVVLVDGAGQLIARADDSDAPDAAGKSDAAPHADVVEEAKNGRDGHARRFAGGSVVAGFSPVGGLGWSVIVEEPADRAFAAARALTRNTLWGTAAAGLIALVVALAFARRLTAALEQLTRAARALGEGKLDTRVALSSDDEVGTLARTFNQMGEELSTSRREIERWNQELEGRVQERTRELKEAQAQLVQAQKLAALGQLGAGLAHEINNPLGGVIGHVQLLLADKAPQSDDYDALKHIEEGARRASEVVQNLLRFSVQRKEPVRTGVDLDKLVRDTLSLTESLIRDQKIDLVYDLAGDKPRARADAGQLAQVLLNLVANARTAMPAGGRLRVATRKEGNQAVVVVEDSGKGIAPEIKERIFEPFFTTKDDWSNVGLGLSVSYRIVEEHGGRIAVDSEVGRGSVFTVYLPAA
ncbi:MAG: histidine kinase [Myxococcales bacterium]|nr:histidine kinase [Myxococcales bacterium]